LWSTIWPWRCSDNRLHFAVGLLSAVVILSRAKDPRLLFHSILGTRPRPQCHFPTSLRVPPIPRTRGSGPPRSPITAVLQLLYTESTVISGFFPKKKPLCTQLNRAHELENGSKASAPLSSLSSAQPLNQKSQNIHLTFPDNPLPYGCGSIGYNLCSFV